MKPNKQGTKPSSGRFHISTLITTANITHGSFDTPINDIPMPIAINSFAGCVFVQLSEFSKLRWQIPSGVKPLRL